jgi:hypothetical protein
MKEYSAGQQAAHLALPSYGFGSDLNENMFH